MYADTEADCQVCAADNGDYGDHQDGEITVMMLIVRMVPLMMTMIVGMVIYGDIYDDDDDLCEHARHDGEAGYFHILLI